MCKMVVQNQGSHLCLQKNKVYALDPTKLNYSQNEMIVDKQMHGGRSNIIQTHGLSATHEMT